MCVIIGTANYLSRPMMEKQWGKETVKVKTDEGLITFGPPPVKKGETLVIIDEGRRYGIKRPD